MTGLIVAIIIIQILIIISLLNVLLSSQSNQPQQYYYEEEYVYIPNISEVVGSSKIYDVSGSWTSLATSTTLIITKISTDKFNVVLNKIGSTTPNKQLIADMDQYNGVLTIKNPVDLGDPYYGDNYANPIMILIIDPTFEDKLIDPYSANVYSKVPKNPSSGNVISHLSGTWKDNYGPDLLDIKLTDYLIEGTLAENKIVGIFNPKCMKFVLFLKGFPIPGYYENNIYYVLFNNYMYEFNKVVEYKPS